MTIRVSPTRSLLVRVAGELLEQDGLEAVTLRAVGRRADLSRSAAYRHFASKEGLLAAVAAADLRALRAAVDGVAEGGGSPLAQLEGMLNAYREFARAHPQRYRLIYAPNLKERDDPELHAAAREAVDSFTSAVARAMTAGEILRGDAREVAALLVAAAHGAADLDRVGHLSEEKWGTNADSVARLLLHVLSAAAPPTANQTPFGEANA